jgi:Fe-S-cluster containining protein
MTPSLTAPLPWPRTWHSDDRLVRSSPFSYQCGACGQCCRDKLIQVNPYEIARLAAELAISTTRFIELHLDGVYLRHREDGSCSFLNDQGCSVHAARPLVCRLYPLGRNVSANGLETFTHLLPHPQSLGTYGEHSRVQDWIAEQGAQDFIDAVDAYLHLFHRLFKSMELDEGSALGVRDWPEHAALLAMPEMLDIDRMLADDPDTPREPHVASTVAQRMAWHCEVVVRRFKALAQPTAANLTLVTDESREAPA